MGTLPFCFCPNMHVRAEAEGECPHKGQGLSYDLGSNLFGCPLAEAIVDVSCLVFECRMECTCSADLCTVAFAVGPAEISATSHRCVPVIRPSWCNLQGGPSFTFCFYWWPQMFVVVVVVFLLCYGVFLSFLRLCCVVCCCFVFAILLLF